MQSTSKHTLWRRGFIPINGGVWGVNRSLLSSLSIQAQLLWALCSILGPVQTEKAHLLCQWLQNSFHYQCVLFPLAFLSFFSSFLLKSWALTHPNLPVVEQGKPCNPKAVWIEFCRWHIFFGLLRESNWSVAGLCLFCGSAGSLSLKREDDTLAVEVISFLFS